MAGADSSNKASRFSRINKKIKRLIAPRAPVSEVSSSKALYIFRRNVVGTEVMLISACMDFCAE